jgi:hypothetical protein
MRHKARRELTSGLVEIVTEAPPCLHGTKFCPRLHLSPPPTT